MLSLGLSPALAQLASPENQHTYTPRGLLSAVHYVCCEIGAKISPSWTAERVEWISREFRRAFKEEGDRLSAQEFMLFVYVVNRCGYIPFFDMYIHRIMSYVYA